MELQTSQLTGGCRLLDGRHVAGGRTEPPRKLAISSAGDAVSIVIDEVAVCLAMLGALLLGQITDVIAALGKADAKSVVANMESHSGLCQLLELVRWIRSVSVLPKLTTLPRQSRGGRQTLDGRIRVALLWVLRELQSAGASELDAKLCEDLRIQGGEASQVTTFEG